MRSFLVFRFPPGQNTVHRPVSLYTASDFWNNNCIDDIYIHILLEAKKEEKKMPNFANTLHTAILVFVRLPFEFDNNLL